jgi:caffeoyl-CoA O-methyltransferase
MWIVVMNANAPRPRRTVVPEPIERYIFNEIARETPVQKQLRAETATLPDSRMQIGPDQGAFLAMLARMIGARRALEIGVYTGYSSLAVAAALPEDGKLIACDVSEEWTAIARRYWAQAGLAQRIELRLGPALTTLKELLAAGRADSFDFAFIDADKLEYDAYYESCLRLVRPGGLIAIDNVLWGGSVADRAVNDPDTVAIRALNQKIRDDRRVEACLLTVGDGLFLVRRLAERRS